MLRICWETVLCLAVLLLLARDSQASRDTNGPCLAWVQYSAITGGPAKARKSDTFRGIVRVEDQMDHWQPRDALLSWTFKKGEIILDGNSVYRGNEGEEAGDIQFSSSTIESTQSVELEYFADADVVDIGFVASKGHEGTAGKHDSRNSIGFPTSMKYNDLVCEEYVDRMDPQFVSIENEADFNERENILELEYLPIEFDDMRFEAGHSSLTIFIFRLTNNGGSPIDLADVEVNYYFDGQEISGRWTPDNVYRSACMTSSPTGCSHFKVSVQPGLENVSGAQYRLVIKFAEDSGLLMPNKSVLQSDSDLMDEKYPSAIEAIMNITSAQIPAQLDATKDYSFLNTTILDDERNLPDELVSRKYELNPRMPVFKNGELVYGYRPKASREKARVSYSSTQNQCWFSKPGSQQCGLTTGYCCFEPAQTLPGPQSQVDP